LLLKWGRESIILVQILNKSFLLKWPVKVVSRKAAKFCKVAKKYFIKLTGKEGNYVVVEVGSGKYHFSSAIQ